jgi:hypothetical protein
MRHYRVKFAAWHRATFNGSPRRPLWYGVLPVGLLTREDMNAPGRVVPYCVTTWSDLAKRAEFGLNLPLAPQAT